MVVTFQNGDCRCFGYASAGLTVAEIPEKAKPKKENGGLMRVKVENIKNDPNYIIYKVSIGNFVGGLYTGHNQAKQVMNDFTAAMDQGEKAFIFPADSPQRRGIFKS